MATTTAICKVEDNSLVYRGYSIDELAPKAEYEEVAYLLLNGDLPTKDQLRDFKAELAKHRDQHQVADREAAGVRAARLDLPRQIEPEPGR